MRIFFFGLRLALLFGVALSAMAQPISDAALVEQFFPQSLVEESAADFARGGPEPSRFSDFVAADLNATGVPEFLVAAYTNGFGAVVRVLKKQGGSAALVAEPRLNLGGIFPTVSLIDLDNDGRPEVVVKFSGATGGMIDWIFKWNGSELDLMVPETIYVGSAAFVDLDGDGILEIVNPPGAAGAVREGPFEYTALKLIDGTYRLSPTVFYFFNTFAPETGASASVTREFSVPSPGVPYKVTIANGYPRDGQRVSSARITVNGVLVTAPSRINQKVAAITIPLNVAIKKTNTVSVELTGSPGSFLSIGIGPQ